MRRRRGWIALAMLTASAAGHVADVVGEWWPLLVLWAAVGCFVALMVGATLAYLGLAAERAELELEDDDDELEQLWRL